MLGLTPTVIEGVAWHQLCVCFIMLQFRPSVVEGSTVCLERKWRRGNVTIKCCNPKIGVIPIIGITPICFAIIARSIELHKASLGNVRFNLGGYLIFT